MKGSVTKPDFKITIGADAGQIEANVVKAINEAVTSINKDTDIKLKKLKVQIDKEALKNQIQNSVSSVHIKQFDGLGKQTGNDIASAIKKANGPSVDKRNVVISKPIKSIGEHKIGVKLTEAVTAHVPVKVVAA